jgi:hypothetical protein
LKPEVERLRRGRLIPGLGGIAFGALTVVGVFLENAPGGNYDAANQLTYVAPGHRLQVVIAVHLHLLAVFGLLALLAHLRQSAASSHADPRSGDLFWSTGLVAAACFAAGLIVSAALPIAMLGRSVDISPPVIYSVVQVGGSLTLAGGGILLGLSLITLALIAPQMFPPWLRWSTLVSGIVGLASNFFVPFFVLLLWAIVAGAWLLLAPQRSARSSP